MLSLNPHQTQHNVIIYHSTIELCDWQLWAGAYENGFSMWLSIKDEQVIKIGQIHPHYNGTNKLQLA